MQGGGVYACLETGRVYFCVARRTWAASLLSCVLPELHLQTRNFRRERQEFLFPHVNLVIFFGRNHVQILVSSCQHKLRKGNSGMRTNAGVHIALDSLDKVIKIVARTREASCHCVPQDGFTHCIHVADALIRVLNFREHRVNIILITMKLGRSNLCACC